MSAVDRVLGSAPVAMVGRALLGRGDVRILAYHAVGDPDRFGAQMEEVVRSYTPVTAGDVVAAVRGARLPSRAVWVTFDDGYRSVVDAGLPILQALGMSATAFVCPAAASTGEPLWFDRVRAAAGVTDPSGSSALADRELAALKQLPDPERRRLVAALPATGGDDPPASADDLRRWIDAGCTVGNHTWDHPCLDRCEPEEQHEQIERARGWIDELQPGGPRLFAFPNGFGSAAAAGALDRLQYDLAVRFDHRVATTRQPHHQLSRLRISDDAPMARFRAVLSGTHSVAFSLKDRRATAR